MRPPWTACVQTGVIPTGGLKHVLAVLGPNPVYVQTGVIPTGGLKRQAPGRGLARSRVQTGVIPTGGLKPRDVQVEAPLGYDILDLALEFKPA